MVAGTTTNVRVFKLRCFSVTVLHLQFVRMYSARPVPGPKAGPIGRSSFILTGLALVAVLLAGCASSDTALLPESERALLVDRTYEETFDLVREALRTQGYEIEAASLESGTIRTGYRPDERIENMSSSAWSRVEASLREAERGTRVVFTARARYSSAERNFGVGSGEMPRDDQRTVLSAVMEAVGSR